MDDDLFADTIRQTTRLRDLILERFDQPAGAERALAETLFRLGRARYGYRRALESMAELSEALAGRLDTAADERGYLSGSKLGAHVESFDRVPFYVEGCYAQLWRIVECCSRRKKPWATLFPELKGFEPVGVRDARNERFEHADHDQLVAWGWSSDGPHLYPEVTLRGGAIDEGLVPNVEQYLRELSDRLAQAGGRLSDENPGSVCRS